MAKCQRCAPIYLQILAAGGLVAFTGFIALTFGTMHTVWRQVTVETALSRALIASTGTWLILGLVENELTDQYLYVPLALAVALWASSTNQTEPLPMACAAPSQLISGTRKGSLRE